MILEDLYPLIKNAGGVSVLAAVNTVLWKEDIITPQLALFDYFALLAALLLKTWGVHVIMNRISIYFMSAFIGANWKFMHFNALFSIIPSPTIVRQTMPDDVNWFYVFLHVLLFAVLLFSPMLLALVFSPLARQLASNWLGEQFDSRKKFVNDIQRQAIKQSFEPKPSKKGVNRSVKQLDWM